VEGVDWVFSCGWLEMGNVREILRGNRLGVMLLGGRSCARLTQWREETNEIIINALGG